VFIVFAVWLQGFLGFRVFGFLSEKHFDLWGSCSSVFLGGVQEFHVLINRFFDVPFTSAPDQRFETVFLSSLYDDVPCHWGRGEKCSDCKSGGCAVYRSFMFDIKAKELEMSPEKSTLSLDISLFPIGTN
jgi:hypothetical protein